MKKLTLCFFFTLIFSISGWAQIFIDTIFTKNSDTVICQITLVNNYNVFYNHLVKKKRRENTFIARSDVKRFCLNSPDVDIMNEEEPPKNNSFGFIENNGIIYPDTIDIPPSYRSSLNDIYQYLERNVQVTLRDRNVFGNDIISLLFILNIDNNGKITSVELDDVPSIKQDYHYHEKYIKEEIKNKILLMPEWNPAKSNNNVINSTIYFPLKFYLDLNKIVLLSSKNAFIFKNRNK